MTLAVAAGIIRIAAVDVAVTAGNVTITAANATNPRTDLVVVSNAGTKSVTAGTAAAVPVPPAVPATSVVLAMVYVPANDTAINTNQITDKRCDLQRGNVVSGVLASFAGGQINAPSTANAGTLGVITDSNTGTIVRSTGSAWVVVAGAANSISQSMIGAKGDLVVGTASSTADNLAVGTPGRVLLPNSSLTEGLEWVVNPYVGSLRAGVAVENASRTQAASATVVAGTTGQLRMVGIWLPARMVCSNVSFGVGSTAAASITHYWAALYDSSLALLRQSTDDPSAVLAASSIVLTGWTSFTTTYAGLHYVGIMATAGTMPTLIGFAGSAILNAAVPINSGTSTGSLLATAPNPAAALTAVGGVPWIYVS